MDYADYNDYELIYLIGEQSEDAFNLLFLKYEPLIKKIAYSFYTNLKYLKLDYEDLVQEGRIGLYKALKSYDIEKDYLFYTFAHLCIKRSILTSIEKAKTKKNLALTTSISYEEYQIEDVPNLDFDPSFLVDEKDLEYTLIKFKHTLDFLDSLIFDLRINSFTYKEISSLLDIKIKNVDNRLAKIKKKLQKFLLAY